MTKIKKIPCREFISSSPPCTNETTFWCCHLLNSCLVSPRKSFSTHRHSHLPLMDPSVDLSDSTWNNIETLVTVKGFNPKCFCTESRGTCADIPDIVRWIGPFPRCKVSSCTERRIKYSLNHHIALVSETLRLIQKRQTWSCKTGDLIKTCMSKWMSVDGQCPKETSTTWCHLRSSSSYVKSEIFLQSHQKLNHLGGFSLPDLLHWSTDVMQ